MLTFERLESRVLLAAPHPVDLATLNGTNGFRLDGLDVDDNSGVSVSSAGDVNGDGFDDLIIGASFADPGGPGDTREGETYVVFGKATGFAASLDLATLDGTNGFRLDGIDASDNSGRSVSSAGDVNGDGFDDLIIGAFLAAPGGDSAAGETYVVFGKATGFTASLDLATLNGTNGFRLDGLDANDRSGVSVSSAGDVNGDGFDDLIIGAFFADPGGDSNAGETYVVFGQATGFAAAIDLATLDGTNGFRLDGLDANDASGLSVSSAGDVNGDGFDDLLIGARGADPGGDSYAGETYVVFGKATGFTASLDLSTLDGMNGFRLDGLDAFDFSGLSVSSAGDVNGDGFDDLIIGADSADPGGDSDAGETYVVFGGNFTGGAETQVGGAGSQTLTANQGSGAKDVLIGGLGADTLISDGGSDVLIGGEGNDSLQLVDVSFSSTRRLDGGSGTDTLRLTGSGLHLDLTAIRDNRIENIEIIDLTGSGNNTLTLNALEVVNLSGHSNTLFVRRNTGDVVNIGSGWTQGASEVLSGIQYKVFTQGAATLKVENVAPIATANTNSTSEAAAVGGNVLTDGTPDSDPDDAANTLMVSAVNGVGASVGSQITLASGALLTVNADGTYTYDPNGAFETVNFGSSTTDSFQYTVQDPSGLTSVATVTITINGADDGFTYTGSSVAVVGTAGADTFQVDLATGVITRNGVAHQLPAGVSVVTIDGGAGSDTLTLLGTSGAEVVRLLPGQGFLDSSAVGVTGSATSMETITYYGQGGADSATLTGSSGADKFVGRDALAFLSGAGFRNTVQGQVMVVANSPTGGSDTAYLFDTAANNRFTATGTTAAISGTGVTANNFETVVGYASDGMDTASLTGSAGNDVFRARTTIATLTGGGIALGAAGFEQLTADGANGSDVARLFGRAGVDTFLAGPTSATLSGTGYQFAATGFETVIVAAAGPGDRATLQDSTGNDQFLGQGNTGTLTTPTGSFAAVGFSQITLRGTNGGTNRRTLRTPPALGFTLIEQGTWV